MSPASNASSRAVRARNRISRRPPSLAVYSLAPFLWPDSRCARSGSSSGLASRSLRSKEMSASNLVDLESARRAHEYMVGLGLVGGLILVSVGWMEIN